MTPWYEVDSQVAAAQLGTDPEKGVPAALGDYLDAGVILAIVVLNAGLGFHQEFRAEKAIFRPTIAPEAPLSVLIFGAGVLGSLYGARLTESVPPLTRVA